MVSDTECKHEQEGLFLKPVGRRVELGFPLDRPVALQARF